ncbi:MAG: chitobiase/beta-hexosaminidase C-terminal domain-containing protein [Candidatus Omnitrophica bacterium]|jgi:phage baseplate assembly protein W|nr:chitobiase/beta-hexosaminidase C-terminal domain-containing protein [Candidatus Omnitrophota bacterium]
MTIVEALALLRTFGVFAYNSFSKTDASELVIQKNLIGGNINLTGASTEIGKIYQYNMPYSLYGKTLKLKNTNTYNGNVYYYTSIDSDSSFVNNDFSTTKNTTVLDIDSIYNQVNAYFNYLRNLEQTGTKRYTTANTTYSFSGTNSINYINLSTTAEISNFNAATVLSFNFDSSSIVIINITTSSTVIFNNKTFSLTNINSSNIIFNISAPNINITGEVEGTVVALDSSIISLNVANIYGQIFAYDILSIGANTLYNSPFAYFDDLYIPILNENTIALTSEIESYSKSITITNDNSLATIFYKINDQSYIKYSDTFELTNIGINLISSYSSLYGYTDSTVVTLNTSLECKCAAPDIIINDNIVTFVSDTFDASIYYTIDGTYPTIDSPKIDNNGTFTITHDGKFDIQAIAINGVCYDSNISESIIYYEFPETSLTINILNDKDIEGNYIDNTGLGVLVQIIDDNNTGTNIYYTEDGANPMYYGTKYTTLFYSKSNKIKAVAYASGKGYSNIFESEIIEIGHQSYIEPSDFVKNSESKSTDLQYTPQYGIDMGWYGPTILVDDNTIYQALVNILSTSFMEIPFRYDFGCSIKSMLFELTGELDSTTFIANLKSEIEYNDPRIDISTTNSSAYFDYSSNAVVIQLEWTNKLTGETARIKYDYSLDGIL